MLDYLAALATLAVLGAHAVVPWRVARGAGPGTVVRAGATAGTAPEPEAVTEPASVGAADPTPAPSRAAARRAWSLAALPLLLAAVTLGAALAARRPHAALGAGWGELALTGAAFRAAAVLLAALALADAVAALGRRRLEPAGWRLVAGFGLAALAAGMLALELLRIGTGPPIALAPVLLAAGWRALLALAAGEALAPGRPWLAPLALPALAGYWLALPPPLAALLRAEGLHWTALAAALLLASAPWLPARLRRPALVAGVLLAAFLLARAAALTAALPLAVPPAAPG
jgi:hypothetical protein